MISPCVGICKIDDNSKLCIGCLRSEEEIAMWPQINNEKALEIINEIVHRSIPKR